MTLNDYLTKTGLSHAAFANEVGDVTEHGVKKWARGERLPRRNALRRIAEVTGGMVTATDFLNSVAAMVPEDIQ